MKTFSPKDLEAMLRFASDPKGQTGDGVLVLTLMDIEQIMGEAKLGPDASACEDARRIKRPAVRRAGEERGYWDLTQGTYWAVHNERVDLPRGAILLLHPHQCLLRNGLWHPSRVVRDWDRDGVGVMLVVSARGVRVEEGTAVSVGFLMA